MGCLDPPSLDWDYLPCNNYGRKVKTGEELKYLRKYTYTYPSIISVPVSTYRSIFALDILYEYLLLVKNKNE